MSLIRHSASDNDLRRLARALRVAGSPDIQGLVAQQIAGMGTPVAFEMLIREVAGGGPASQACASVLSQSGAAAPHVMRALLNDPDCAGLVACLPRQVDEDTARRLCEIGRRTTNPWVLRQCAEIVARSAPAQCRPMWEAVRRRGSEVLAAAFEIGTLAASPERLPSRIVRFLEPNAPVEVQKLALGVFAAVHLPQGRDCVRRLLKAGRVRERCFALRVIGAAKLSEFGEAALDAFVEDRSPSVHDAAFRTIPSIAAAVAEAVPARAERQAEALMQAARELNERLKGHGAGDRLETAAPYLKRIDCALTAALDVASAAFISGADSTGALIVALPAARWATIVLGPLCEDDAEREMVWPLMERLLEYRAGRFRDLMALGHPQERLTGLILHGLCTVALERRHRPGPPVPRGVDWDEILRELGDLSRRLVGHHGVANNMDEAPGDFPLTGRYLLRDQMQFRVQWAKRCCADAGTRALAALEASLDCEKKARSRAARRLGQEAVADAQLSFNDAPMALWSPMLSAMGKYWELHVAGQSGAAPGGDAPIIEMLAEQTLQSALLGILSLAPSRVAVPALVRCLRSASSLVAECAESIVMRLGSVTVPELMQAAAKTRSDLQRARLLEICRCLDARAALTLAREHIRSEEPVLRAVCARAIGDVGDCGDVPAVLELLGTGDELVDVCAIRALARLDAPSHAGLFASRLSSPYPGIRWAAFSALRECPQEAMVAAVTPPAQSDNVLAQAFAEYLLADQGAGGGYRPYAGSVFRACGDTWLGTRVACEGKGPWDWGIGALMPGPESDWEKYADFIGSDPVVSDCWVVYTTSGLRPPALTERLCEMVHGEPEERAQLATALLWDLNASTFEWALGACLSYNGMDCTPERRAAAVGLLRRLLRENAPEELVAQVAAPNPSLSNPLSWPSPMSEESSGRDLLPMALYLRFLSSLPAALGIMQPVLPPISDPGARRAAIEAEWEHLCAFQDFSFGFWVKPRLSPDDLLWYCRQEDAGPELRRAMVNTLVLSGTVLLQLAEDREAALRCLRQLFAPLLKKTTKKLGEACGGNLSPDEIRQAVDRTFLKAIGTYDAFHAEPRGIGLPLATLTSTLGGAPSRRSMTAGGYDLTQTHVPFAHFLERSLAQLVREERAVAARRACALAEGDDALETMDIEQAARTLAAEQAATADTVDSVSDDEFIGLLTGTVPATGYREDAVQTVTLEIDGEQVSCVDIATAAALLGTSADTLRKRERRGALRFLRHVGRRYLPFEGIAELAAREPTNQELADMLGVSERTVRRWKAEAPPELSAAQLLGHLQGRTNELASRRGKRAAGRGDS